MLASATLPGIVHVAQRLRPLDRKECLALLWGDDEMAIARHAMAAGEPGWIAHASDGEPVYAFGMTPTRPCCWACWGFGTMRFPEVMIGVSRFVKFHLVPGLLDTDALRMELLCLAEKVEAHKWLRLLGARETIELPCFGRNGEDFKMLVWRR